MAFWKPGAPAPPLASHVGLVELDGDAERHRPPPVYNVYEGLPLQQQRAKLPIHRRRLDLLHAVETHGVVVVCGPTGCGKSTQLPQYLDEAGWTANGYVVAVTLPRRIAAIALADRVAQEMNERLGLAVGYRIRFDSCYERLETRLEFMTEEVLIREMLGDPLLTRYSVVLVDEVHERSVQTDLLLGLLKKVSRKRPRLRIVLASATVDVEALARFFQKQDPRALRPPGPRAAKRLRAWDDDSGDYYRQREEDTDWRQLCRDLDGAAAGDQPELQGVCVVALEGQRQHPVQIHYLDQPAADYLEAAVAAVFAIHDQQPPDGDILVFLTGREEIEAVCSVLRERIAGVVDRPAYGRPKRQQQEQSTLHVVPLYGALPLEAQLRAFAPPPVRARKVVVSTNIAEASVTIDGIVYVVDACFVKLDAFCPHNGVSYLTIAPCSKSATRQRAGRAGRTAPGHCYRLLTEAAFDSVLSDHTLPEVARADLKDAVLLLKCLGVDDVGAFDFVTPPSRVALEVALEDLYALGAIDGEARLVEPLGLRLAHGPAPLLLMRLLLLSADFGCSAEAAAVCGMLSVQPPWLPSKNKDRLHACQQSFAVYEGDLVSLLNVGRQYETYRSEEPDWARNHLLNSQILERSLRIKQELLQYLQRFDLPIKSCQHDVLPLQRLACAALFLNAARRTPSGTYRLCRPLDEQLAPHFTFALHHASVLAGVDNSTPADFVVATELRCFGEAPELMQNTRIKAEWLPELAPHYFVERAAGVAPSKPAAVAAEVSTVAGGQP